MTRASPIPRTREGILQLEGYLDRWIAALQRLNEATERLHQAATSQLAQTVAFTDAVGELAGPAAETLAERAQTLPDASFQDRATHRFSGPGASAKAVEFLRKYATERLHAVIHVDDPTRLDLRSMRGVDGRVRIRGRIVLVTPAEAKLEDVVVEDPTRDHLTVVAGGRLHLSGRVQAALVARGGLSIDPEAQLSGSLVVAGPLDISGLAGRLDDGANRHAAGVTGAFDPRHTHVSLSPWAQHRVLTRE